MMWKTMWINVKNFLNIRGDQTNQQVWKLFLLLSTTYPQFSLGFSQGTLVARPHINNPYYYYLFLELKNFKRGLR